MKTKEVAASGATCCCASIVFLLSLIGLLGIWWDDTYSVGDWDIKFTADLKEIELEITANGQTVSTKTEWDDECKGDGASSDDNCDKKDMVGFMMILAIIVLLLTLIFIVVLIILQCQGTGAICQKVSWGGACGGFVFAFIFALGAVGQGSLEIEQTDEVIEMGGSAFISTVLMIVLLLLTCIPHLAGAFFMYKSGGSGGQVVYVDQSQNQ